MPNNSFSSRVAPEHPSESGSSSSSFSSSSSKTVVAPAESRIQPVPPHQWPLWVRAIAKFRHPADLGLGDTVVHLIGDTRSERFKKWFARKFGRSCGCAERQQWLNRKFSYTIRKNNS